jgi:TolA-binding protein
VRQHPKGSLGLPFVVFGLLATAALAGGCATGDESLPQDVAQLRKDLNALTLAVHRSRAETETSAGQTDRRTRTESAETARQVNALSTRLDNIAAELGRVSARLEDVSGRLDALNRQVAARASAPAPPAGQPTAPTPPIAPAAPRGAADGTSAEQAFQAASLDLTKGNYPLAVSGFREFVRRFPDSPLADKAQYSVGEAYFGMARASSDAGRRDEATRHLEQSVQEFRRVVVNYPRGERVPTALYKEALALIELKQPRLAEARLRYLIEHFPQSQEAPLAREKLANPSGS